MRYLGMCKFINPSVACFRLQKKFQIAGYRLERTGSHLLPRRSFRRQASPSRSTRNFRAAPVSTSAAKLSCAMALFLAYPCTRYQPVPRVLV